MAHTSAVISQATRSAHPSPHDDGDIDPKHAFPVERLRQAPGQDRAQHRADAQGSRSDRQGPRGQPRHHISTLDGVELRLSSELAARGNRSRLKEPALIRPPVSFLSAAGRLYINNCEIRVYSHPFNLCSCTTDPTYPLDRSVFGGFAQAGCGSKVSVLLQLCQYMERGTALACGESNFAGG